MDPEEHGENIRMKISGHAAPAFLVSNLDESPSTSQDHPRIQTEGPPPMVRT